MGIFGTDGVRGIGYLGYLKDPYRSFQEKRLFSKQLCGEIAFSATMVSGEGDVLIGWDRRPYNEKIAEHVIECLRGTGRKISILGETTTPALQFIMLKNGATLGLMITASHNPSEDTGVKILFENGRKPTEDEQLSMERIMFQEERKSFGDLDVGPLSTTPYISSVKEAVEKIASRGIFPQNEILIDSSGGWLSTWLADLISSMGVACKEVSERELPINFHCGAGDLSEGWISWEECAASSHSLLRSVSPSKRGTILGFCFDGDGDRCYLICSEGQGIQIIGGDGFLRLFSMICGDLDDFFLALTIESALDVLRIFKNLGNGRLIQTGVGDRWLQHALIREKSPFKIGTEPSGHIILEQKCGSKTGLWGDGVSTMLEFLKLIHRSGIEWIESVTGDSSAVVNQSVYPSRRELWDPDGELAEEIKDVICQVSDIAKEELNRVEIEEEQSLLLLNFYNGEEWSVSIRNSGTEPKTRVTIRTTEMGSGLADTLMRQIMSILEPKLNISTRS